MMSIRWTMRRGLVLIFLYAKSGNSMDLPSANLPALSKPLRYSSSASDRCSLVSPVLSIPLLEALCRLPTNSVLASLLPPSVLRWRRILLPKDVSAALVSVNTLAKSTSHLASSSSPAFLDISPHRIATGQQSALMVSEFS